MSVQYVCQNCSTIHPKWAGKCSSCNAWNVIVEEEYNSPASSNNITAKLDKSLIKDINTSKNKLTRYVTGLNDLDQVLGGGLVAGSVVMLAGQPGIGKSTLLMQVAGRLDKDELSALYVTAEESEEQVKDRADRLGVVGENVFLSSSQSTDAIVANIIKDKPKVCIIDSIQTVKVQRLLSAPGTVSQVTNSIHALSSAAKKANTTLIIVGHVTKEGSIAGPKVLEHLVDVVLYIEGDRYESLRVLRSSKNRFGSTQESALLKMDESGLSESDNISASLIAEKSDVDGSVVAAIIEGSQPLLVEIQALVSETSFGNPKRSASGFDLNRLNILIAVLNKRTKLNLADKDIFINVAGGIKIKDTGADLAVCMAIASACTGKKIDEENTVFGEVGLGGEIRSTRYIQKRVQESKKYNFKKIIGPNSEIKDRAYISIGNLRDSLIKFLK